MIKNQYCKNCGNKLEFENAEICPLCKINFKTSHQYYFNYCSICGKKLDLSANIPIEICPHCGVRLIEKTEFHLTDFVSENSGLFITSSVFIALAVYLSQFGLGVDKSKFIFPFESFQINIFDVAIGASIFLSLIISSLIVKKMIVNFYHFRFSRNKNYLRSFAGVKVIIFLSLFCFLLGGLFLYFYITYRIVFGILLLITAYALAPYLLYVLYKILNFDMNAQDFRGKKKVFYFLVMGMACCLIYLLSFTFLNFTSDNPILKIIAPFLGVMILVTSLIIFFDWFILLIWLLIDSVNIIYKKIKTVLKKPDIK